MVVVDLQENPPEHLFRGEEVRDICSVVRGAGVAGAGLEERLKGGGVVGCPHIDP